MIPQPRRKKWTEAEERTLIDKYREMVCDGTLAKMKTREKKYKPIALHVNSIHNLLDPVAYPWQWTWKDVSTKVQNMRHQYTLVKQKIVKGEEEFDWDEGNMYWSNFIRYKEVFGDVPLVFGASGQMVLMREENANNGRFEGSSSHMMDIVNFGHLGPGNFSTGIHDVVDNGVMDLEFEYDREEGEEEDYSNGCNKGGGETKEDGEEEGFVCEDVESVRDMRKKRKVSKCLDKQAWDFVAHQLGHLREMEARFEQCEVERERERQRRDHLQIEIEQERERKRQEMEEERDERIKAREKLRSQRIQEWETMEREFEERERKRREEESMHEREREERLGRSRSEWNKRIYQMLSHHRAETSQIQARILDEQQNLTSQLLGIVSQWTSHPAGLSDHTGGASNHYLSQMMHHVNGIVHGDARVEGDDQEDQFIVDG